jgi:hypothetical protein
LMVGRVVGERGRDSGERKRHDGGEQAEFHRRAP